MASGERLDLLMAARGLAESRAHAQRLVMAGRVRVDGQPALKPSQRVGPQATVVVEAGPAYVSRGGDKLAAALAAFPVRVQGQVCADVGASTGGFSDCLLQHGAARVYAIDVGHGLLHWRLRNDARVVALERTNARTLRALPERVGLVTVDAAFISLRLLVPVIVGWLAPQGEAVLLIKPQFEAGREAVGRGGVVRSSEVHARVLDQVWQACQQSGLAPRGLLRSPLRGPKGNVEFLLWCGRQPQTADCRTPGKTVAAGPETGA
jgi:23S rRNA (cytidine1920-2'-O)/16S rRNA (cytidine1409-2'-O)-methyltransferase